MICTIIIMDATVKVHYIQLLSYLTHTYWRARHVDAAYAHWLSTVPLPPKWYATYMYSDTPDQLENIT